MWLEAYEDPSYEYQLRNISHQIRPLFEELHGYVRHALGVKYGTELVDSDKAMPMHLLGNMWAQAWGIVSQ